jgi:zinc protease
MTSIRIFSLFIIMVSIIFSCESNKVELKINYEKYTLANGLEVIIHQDHSDPLAAVAILYHVGSNREQNGRTGFAHLFEHMLFQESKHVGQDQFFKKIQDAGGTLNGFTFEDGTGYYEVIPKNALEKVLWMESDRMGWLLPTVTQEAFVNQQDVVKNEKRQRVDNRPYGHTNYIICKLLYPENHPYNWQVIGSLEDLSNATLSDVHNFHKKWYGPNNATLVVAGDLDVPQAKQWVEKYFGEIPASVKVADPEVQLVTLDETKRAFHEDNFAKSPELNMVFPTVDDMHKDVKALSVFAQLFSDGKKAPLYKVIVEQQKLAPSVRSYSEAGEIAGVFRVRIQSFPEKSLGDVENAVKEAFQLFETEKFTEEDLNRIKAKIETNFYNGISTVLDKSFQLAFYNEYNGTPGYISDDLQRSLKVTSDDVWRVYNTYVKGKPYIVTSFVPKGQSELAAPNSERFPLAEEDISKVKQDAASKEEVITEEIPSAFDRTVEPANGPDPLVSLPKIWHQKFDNNILLQGIEQNELPLIQFTITLKGGMLLDDMKKIGVANLISDMMMEGTKNKTPIELEEAIDALGANIHMYTDKESVVLRVNTLKSRFDQVFEIVKEILLEPRWDEKEFERIKKETIEEIRRREAIPSYIAENVYAKLIYKDDNILANNTFGTAESVTSISIDDLKEFYEKNFSPSLAYISIVGDISKEKALDHFKALADSWAPKEVNFVRFETPEMPREAVLYFVDVPDAKQSEIRIGYPGLAYTDNDFYPATVMNYKLGGSFSGILNMVLREEKGYTYGARSRFSASDYPGPFTASAAVQSNATYESVKIFKELMSPYRKGISEEELEFTKNALIKSNARDLESFGNLVFMLNVIARYDMPLDYIKRYEKIAQDMTQQRHKELAEKYLDPDKMIYLVVGDAATQLQPLKKLGLGKVILSDKDDNPI